MTIASVCLGGYANLVNLESQEINHRSTVAVSVWQGISQPFGCLVKVSFTVWSIHRVSSPTPHRPNLFPEGIRTGRVVRGGNCPGWELCKGYCPRGNCSGVIVRVEFSMRVRVARSRPPVPH